MPLGLPWPLESPPASGAGTRNHPRPWTNPLWKRDLVTDEAGAWDQVEIGENYRISEAGQVLFILLNVLLTHALSTLAVCHYECLYSFLLASHGSMVQTLFCTITGFIGARESNQ